MVLGGGSRELDRAFEGPGRPMHEIGDVLAWLASLTDQLGLSLEDAAQRYAGGCPGCGATPCACP